jgi:hypothetical protein
MIEPTLNRASHFSIVWGVVLAVLTIVEWNSLDRDPLSEQIFLPFIEREITLSTTGANTTTQPAATAGDPVGENGSRNLQTHVQIDFNGPLFLVYFIVPILVFHGIGLLSRKLRRGGKSR